MLRRETYSLRLLKTNRLANYLANIRWMDVLALVIGAVLLNEFFASLTAGLFTPSGMSQRFIFLATHNNLFSLHVLFLEASRYTIILAPLAAIILFVTSVAMLLFILRGLFAFIATLIFLCYYLSHLGVPGTWTFEYLLPLLYTGCVWLASLPDHALLKNKKKAKWLGFKVFQDNRISLNVFIIFVSAVLLWYVNYLSNNVNQLSNFVGIETALMFAALMGASLFLDKRRDDRFRHHYFNSSFRKNHPYYTKLLQFSWLDLLTVIIGAMLVFQIYEDALLHWFTITGYQRLIDIYTHYSHTPHWFLNFVTFAGDKANVMMPIQLAVESVCALGLVILVLRAPFIIITTALFALLSYIEFGVPATWPASPTAPLTWTWELLLTTVVSFILCIYQLGMMMRAKTMAQCLLGANLFGETKFYFRLLISVGAGLLMVLVVVLSHALGQFNHVAAIESGLTLFFYVLILSVIDYARQPH